MSRLRTLPESSSSISSTAVGGDEAAGGNGLVNALKEKRCQFWLPNKSRHCANSPLPLSISVFKENLESHLKRCPSRKQVIALEAHAYYSKGINSGFIDFADDDISSEAKRRAIYGLNILDFLALVKKIESLHAAVVGYLEDSYLMPEACEKWLRRQIDSKIPYQERHVLQQASILGNMEKFGILHRPKNEIIGSVLEEGEGNNFVQKKGELPAVVEFGAGRVEDLNLHAVESLNGQSYLAVGKHLCGNATDRRLFLDHGITKQDFYAITWFSSWAVDADHSSNISNQSDRSMDINAREVNEVQKLFGPVEYFMGDRSVEETIRNMKAVDRAAFGFKCKDIIDMGRVLWLREQGLDAVLVKYVPHRISPENHLLLAKSR
ncbi:tRNA guanosine-2'-O-methyltransferase TRM13 [Dendrobium catenatum]|uniref:tRNA:m(4)X modification enzyme TRM13 n=1 Tax=Dendrobium catenatum TaxID=906689 RepID=A0A2I0VGC2_9ASPA|nr:tRNA guanosine-2'-O-methyltransferase TRM13 [Dendrobium catenatum]